MRTPFGKSIGPVVAALIAGAVSAGIAYGDQAAGPVPDPSEGALVKLAKVIESAPAIRLTSEASGIFLVSRPTAFSDGIHHLGALPPASREALSPIVPWKEIAKLEVERDYGEAGACVGMLLGVVATYLITHGSNSNEYATDSGKYWTVAIATGGAGAALGYLTGKDLKRWAVVWPR